jgi:hypothetical protein
MRSTWANSSAILRRRSPWGARSFASSFHRPNGRTPSTESADDIAHNRHIAEETVWSVLSPNLFNQAAGIGSLSRGISDGLPSIRRKPETHKSGPCCSPAPVPLWSARRASAKRAASLGRSQVVRQRILIPPFPGSSPGAPASKSLCWQSLNRRSSFVPEPHSERHSASHSEYPFHARSLIDAHGACGRPAAPAS